MSLFLIVEIQDGIVIQVVLNWPNLTACLVFDFPIIPENKLLSSVNLEGSIEFQFFGHFQ